MSVRERVLLTTGLVTLLLGGCPVETPDPNSGGDPNHTQTDPNDGNGGGSSSGNDSDPNAPTLADVRAAAEQIALARVYGDASAGSRTVSGDTRLGDNGDINTQYADFEVPAGVTLTVQSGTIIRCTGRFVNNGTIVVQSGAEGGRRTHFSSSVNGVTQAPQAGIATLGAGAGVVGDDPDASLGGGVAAIGLSEFESRGKVRPETLAGGGGGPALSGGGAGGGGVLVLAMGTVTNNGTILAPGGDAPDGGGGGGGGQVILASRTSVTQTASGATMAPGGSGGSATSAVGPGGGGGGGVVHFIAPEVTDDGVTDVSAGAGGASGAVGSITAAIRAAGGGGGASGGAGGDGGGVMPGPGDTGTPLAAGAAVGGFALATEIDPTVLY